MEECEQSEMLDANEEEVNKWRCVQVKSELLFEPGIQVAHQGRVAPLVAHEGRPALLLANQQNNMQCSAMPYALQTI